MHFIDSSGIGGIETHIHLITKYLRSNNYDASIIFFKDYGFHPIENKLIQDKVPYIKLSGKIINLIHHLKEAQPGILHTHGYKAGIIGKIIGKILNIPTVSTYHSGDLGFGMLKIYSLVDNNLSRLCLPLVVSQEIKNRLPTTSYEIKNAIEINSSNNHSKFGKNVGFIGRLSYEKGPDLLLKIAQNLPNFHFHIYGDGPLREALSLNKPNNCTFHGFINDIDTVWDNIDLLCMPSREEGLPMALLEAMNHYIPVIGSRVGQLPAVIQHQKNGYLNTSENIQEFTQSIQSWDTLSDTKKENISRNAFYTVKNNHNIAIEIHHLISLYKKAVFKKTKR